MPARTGHCSTPRWPPTLAVIADQYAEFGFA